MTILKKCCVMLYLILVCLCVVPAQKAETRLYDFECNQYDESVLGSSPQRLISLKKKRGKAIIKLESTDCTRSVESLAFAKDAPTDKTFLEQTELVDYDSSDIQELSQKLGLPDSSVLDSVKATLIFLKPAIQYDARLAQEINGGLSYGRSASETVRTGLGTCSEYTNVFIALMRLNAIPCKFIAGFLENGGQFMLHSWAEFYLPESGWIPVDPQIGGRLGVTSHYVKLAEGLDFKDTRLDFPNLYLNVRKVKTVTKKSRLGE